VPTHHPHRPLHEQVDRPVVLGEREQVRQPDQQQEQIAREASGQLAVADDAQDDLVGGEVHREGADQEGRHQHQRPEVDRHRAWWR
jgi:hypothetical protein